MEFIEYPKYLYRGGTDLGDSVLVADAEEEAAAAPDYLEYVSEVPGDADDSDAEPAAPKRTRKPRSEA